MRYYGAIGFAETVQTEPDIWETDIVEHTYSGEINRVSTGWKTSEQINDDLSVSMEISFVGDIHALENYNRIRYATWRGTKWRVTNVQETPPRLILTLGGEYNDFEGSQAEAEQNAS